MGLVPIRPRIPICSTSTTQPSTTRIHFPIYGPKAKFFIKEKIQLHLPYMLLKMVKIHKNNTRKNISLKAISSLLPFLPSKAQIKLSYNYTIFGVFEALLSTETARQHSEKNTVFLWTWRLRKN